MWVISNLFPFPLRKLQFGGELKIESMLTNSLISENHRDKNGDFTGTSPKRVEPNLVLLIFCAITCLKIKIKINKRCKYVSMCFFFFA